MKGNLPVFLHLGQNWHIETRAALAALADYANDLKALESGAKWADLGLSQRREASKSSFEKSGTSGRVAVIHLTGVMRLQDGLCSDGIQTLAANLRSASQDPTVSAIFVEANTGGGESLAGQEFMNAVAESSKPVVFYAHFLASAGVMASLKADAVFAAGAQTEIGSIGVRATVDNEMMAWYNQTFTDYYADTSENKNEEARSLQQGDASKLIETLNRADDLFMSEVRATRKLKGGKAMEAETLSGRMFFAADAERRGLIDGIKTRSEAMAYAENLAAQYQKNGRPKKGKKMANILEGTLIGKALGIGTAETDETVVSALETKFTELNATAETLAASNTDLAGKLAVAAGRAEVAETSLAALTNRTLVLETENEQLVSKASSLLEEKSALENSVKELESEKTRLSKNLSALLVGNAAPRTSNENADSESIEKQARKVFGGEVAVA